jgi:hypothetical protein
VAPGWRSDSSGNIWVDAPDTTLDGLLVHGAVVSVQPGLSILRSRIECTGENDWCVTIAGRSTIVDTEIGGGADGRTYGHAIGIYTGGSGSGNIIRRVNIHHTIHGMRVDGGTVVEDCWIHDMPMGDDVRNLATGVVHRDDHTNGIMSTAGSRTVLRHNRIESGNTATLFVQWNGGERIGEFVVERNLFVNVDRNGQVASWGVGIENKGIDGPITVRDNVFTNGWEVAPIMVPPGAAVTGNTDGSGRPVD